MAVLVLLAGVVLGKVAEVTVRRIMDLTERLAGRYGKSEQAVVSPVFRHAFPLAVFATVLVFAVVFAVRLLDIEHLTNWLESVLVYVPRFLLGLFIIGIGNLVGALLRTISAGVLARGDANALLPRLVHFTVLTVAIITGLQQVGIDISFIIQLALIALASLLGGLSIAFALGARQYVANLMAQNELHRYVVGDRLRIDEHEGVVVEITRTTIVLGTGEGQLAVPAARLASGPVLRLKGDD